MAFLNERARERLERLEPLASWMRFLLRRKRPSERRERPNEWIDRAFFRVDRAAPTRAAVVVAVVVVVRECGESSLVSFRFVSPGVPMTFLES